MMHATPAAQISLKDTTMFASTPWPGDDEEQTAPAPAGPLTVSPYLNQPLRSYEQALAAARKARRQRRHDAGDEAVAPAGKPER